MRIKTFKNTQFGDLTGQHWTKGISVTDTKLDSLEGAPAKVSGNFYCNNNNLVSLKHAPTEIEGAFYCKDNNIVNVKKQIIENRIRAEGYVTDDGTYYFSDIEKEFNAYVPLETSVKSRGFRKLLGLNK